MKRKYRFYYHYNRQNKTMSVHFKNICYYTKYVQCQVPCETKYNKRQPYLVMQGFAKDITEHFQYGESVITIL